MGNPRPETHRRSLVAPAFSSDPAITGLVGETTADDAIANLGGRVTAVEGAGANLDGRVTALEGAPAAGGTFMVKIAAPAGGANTYSAGPAGVQPTAAQVISGGVVANFYNLGAGVFESRVASVADPTAYAYFTPGGGVGGFAFVNGGIEIQHSILVPAAGEYWLPSGVATIVTLFY